MFNFAHKRRLAQRIFQQYVQDIAPVGALAH